MVHEFAVPSMIRSIEMLEMGVLVKERQMIQEMLYCTRWVVARQW